MNKLNFLILFSLLFFICCGQSKKANTNFQPNHGVGIGLLTANTNYSIPLYQNPKDEIPTDSISIKEDKTGVTKFITDLNFQPYALSDGDSYEEGERHISMGLIRFSPELKFRVIDSTENAFKIVTNENTGEFFYLKKDKQSNFYNSEIELSDNNCENCPNSSYNPKWYIFETWENYLKRAEFITKKDLKIYDKPNGKIIFEDKENDFLPFNIIELKGDWANLKKARGREFSFDKSKNYNGWTQWKKGNEILIDITEHTYE